MSKQSGKGYVGLLTAWVRRHNSKTKFRLALSALSLLFLGGLFLAIPSRGLLTQQKQVNGPKISLLTSVFNADEFFEFFLVDITNQTYFDQSELLLGVCGTPTKYVEGLIQQYSEKHKNIIRYNFPKKMPLYEVWNQLIKRARGEYITNANIDDGRHPESLEICSKWLDDHPDYDLLSVGVRTTSVKNKHWYDLKAGQYDDWFVEPKGFEVTMRHMFKYDAYGKITSSQNLPHNGPMWRRKVHERAGFFDLKYDPVSDWELWIRMLVTGSRSWHLNQVVNMYYINLKSHNRVNNFEDKIQTIEAMYSGLTFCRQLNVFIAFEDIPTMGDGSVLLLRSIIRQIRHHGHNVFLSFRFDHKMMEAETLDYLKAMKVMVVERDTDLHSLHLMNRTGIIVDLAIFYHHAHVFAAGSPELGRKALRRSHSEAVSVILTDDSLQNSPKNPECNLHCRNQLRIREQGIMPGSHLVLTMSETNKQRLNSNFPEITVDQFTYIPDALALPLSTSDYKARSGLILTLPNLRPDHPILLLLLQLVMPVLIQRDQDLTLTVVSSEHLTETISRFNFLRACPEDQVQTCFNNARIAIAHGNSSVSESMNTFAAVMHGVPVIMAKSSILDKSLCCPGKFGCGAFMQVDETDSFAFADKIWELYSNAATWRKQREVVLRGRRCFSQPSSKFIPENALFGLMRWVSMKRCTPPYYGEFVWGPSA